VGPMVTEVAVGLDEESDELVGIEEDAHKPHHGQVDEGVEQPATGSLHLLAPKANALDTRVGLAQSTDQVGSVQGARGFAGADEDAHGTSCHQKQQGNRKPERRASPPVATGGLAKLIVRRARWFLATAGQAGRWPPRPCDSPASAAPPAPRSTSGTAGG